MDVSKIARGPQPGMSLTTEPGGRPWENPPKYVKVEDVINHYIPSLQDDAGTENLMDILERGISVNSLVDTLINAGTMKGVHTLESGLLAGPVIAEVIKTIAEIEGVEYVESYEDLAKKKPSAGMVSRAMKKLAELEEAEMRGESAPMEEEAPVEMDKPKKRGIAIIASAAPLEEISTEEEEDGV